MMGGVSASTDRCAHVPGRIAEAVAPICQECGSAVSLRLCATCGHVGCCESQASHGRAHALAEKHPVIKSLPLTDGSFTWCYDCGRYVA